MSRFVLFFVPLLLIVSSCKWKTTKQALQHGEDLKNSIEDFEKNRQSLSTKLVKSLETAEEKLVIGYATKSSSSPFWVILNEGAQQAAGLDL